jgi:hypothetical protein
MGSFEDYWTESRITAACALILERLTTDFEGTGLPTIEFRIDPTWSRSDDIPSGISPYHPRPEDVIVSCRGHEYEFEHEFPLGLDSGVEWACSNAAHRLQDDVMDEHNQPWPELLDSVGRCIDVIAPPGSDLGLAQVAVARQALLVPSDIYTRRVKRQD